MTRNSDKPSQADEQATPSPEPTPSPESTPPLQPELPARRGGRVLGLLALLVGLAALGGAGYLYYELIHLRPDTDQAARMGALEGEVSGFEQRLRQIATDQQQALDDLRESERRARETTERALRESLSQLSRQAPPSTGEWQRAEVQYLLRIANHRLLMERDVDGALRLLQAADSILQQLDDFALHEVRARLADEIAALESVQGIDVQGLFLRLEAAKNGLDQLPLRLPEYLASEPDEPPGRSPAEQGFWEMLGQELSGYLQVRRFDGAVKPLLAPEEAVYLELNLRLMLERAQLAAVRRDQLIYQQSIATAIDWIHEYLDVMALPAGRMLTELAALQQIDLEQQVPDISGSLNALRAALRTSA